MLFQKSVFALSRSLSGTQPVKASILGIFVGLLLVMVGSFASAEERIVEPFEGSSFPNKDWSLHGGPQIGTQAPGSNTILDNAIGNNSGIHLSAWATGAFNVSNEQTSGGNAPAGYTIDPNQLDLTEAIFRIVKYADTVQTDHWGWGMKIDALYGKDYYMFLSKGLFSNQLIPSSGTDTTIVGKKYGYDLPQFYADFYTPAVAQGLNVRVGRILTDPTVYFGRNQLFTHTIFDNNIGDTQTGVITTTRVSQNVIVQLGGVNTADVAISDRTDSKLTGYAAVQWNSPGQSDSVYLEAYNVNNGDYAYHNWQTYYAIWTHKFDSHFFNRLQTAYFYENNVPVLNQNPNAQASGLGFAIRNPGENNISASAQTTKINGYSFVDTMGYSIDDRNYVVGRLEYTSDPEGSVTGSAADYFGWTLGMGHNFTPWMTGTAEVRQDYSYKSAAFDNGAQNHLDLFAASLTFHM